MCNSFDGTLLGIVDYLESKAFERSSLCSVEPFGLKKKRLFRLQTNPENFIMITNCDTISSVQLPAASLPNAIQPEFARTKLS